MSQYPKINNYSPEKERGRDFLGQQATIQALTGVCLPTFTNSTAILRYYSFWPWAFKMLVEHGSKLEGIKRNRYLWKLETALNIANRMRDPDYKGMPGVQGVKFPDIEAPDDLEVVIDYEKNDRTSAYSPVQYSPSLTTLRIVARRGKDRPLDKYGKTLAKIFDDYIKQFEGYSRLVDPDSRSLSMGHLRNLMPALSLENVLKEEQNCFLEVIEQNEVNVGLKNGMTPRIQTTRMLLDIIRTQKAKPSEDTIAPIWDGSYEAPEILKSITHAWRIVRGRQFFQRSLESQLSAFLLFIDDTMEPGNTLVEFSETLFERLGRGELLGFTMLEFDTHLGGSQSFGELCDYLYKFCKSNNIDEDTIESAIKERPVSKSHAYQYNLSSEIGVLGLLLQILLFRRTEELGRGVDEMGQSFLNHPPGYKLSFTTFAKVMERCMQMPARDGLYELLSETMLLLHLGVAQEKWAQMGNFTFRFVRADDGGYVRHIGSSINDPNATGNKLWAYISLLRYLGFWEYGEDDVMVLTQTGRDYLAQAVPLND